MRVLLAALLVVALAACASPSSSPSPSESPEPSGTPPVTFATSAAARDDRFALTIEIPRQQYAPDEAVEVSTTYTFLGPEATATASGSGSGLVILSLEQLDGPLAPGGGAHDDCRAYDLVRGVPNVVPYSKSGGWSADDPNAAWYTAFFADPALRLPAGTWRLTAHLEASLEACSGDWHELDASVTFQVVD